MTGAELREARKAQGLTQATLAARAGVSRDTVQYWGEKVDSERLGSRKTLGR
jgi:transcriptional regulator with XRE-family HTH domain